MNSIVEGITNNISFTLSNINLLKNIFLKDGSIDNYNICNNLRINFKKFYQEILEQISNLDDDKKYDLSLIAVKYEKIKSDFDRLKNNNKALTENIINAITYIKDLVEFLIIQQQKIPLDKKEMLTIQNQIMCFRNEILH